LRTTDLLGLATYDPRDAQLELLNGFDSEERHSLARKMIMPSCVLAAGKHSYARGRRERSRDWTWRPFMAGMPDINHRKGGLCALE
jgi:hypothetical protein